MQSDQDICLQVSQWIEGCLGLTRETVSVPEADKGEDYDARIDLLVKCSTKALAFEHTRVGPYLGFEKDIKMAELFESLLQERTDFLEQFERLDYCFSFNWHSGYSTSKARERFAGKCIDSARIELAQLRQRFDEERHFSTRQISVDSQALLLRYWRGENGVHGTTVTLLTGSDIEVEQQRVERLRDKLSSKLEKLRIWHERSAETVLVLEDLDLALSNQELVGSAVMTVLDASKYTPNHVIYIDSSTPNHRILLPMRLNDVWDISLYTEQNLERFNLLPPIEE